MHAETFLDSPASTSASRMRVSGVAQADNDSIIKQAAMGFMRMLHTMFRRARDAFQDDPLGIIGVAPTV